MEFCNGRHFFLKENLDESQFADKEETEDETPAPAEGVMDIHCTNLENKQKEKVPKPAKGQSITKDFEDRYKALVSFLEDLILPRLKALFSARTPSFNADFPQCVDLEDCLEAHAQPSNCGKKMRGFAHDLQNHAWTKQTFGDMATVVMAIAGLKCVNVLVEDGGKAPKQRRKHGSIRGLCVRMSQTHFGDRLRKVGMVHHKEVLHNRFKKKPKDGVVTLIEANVADHGFKGWLGLCEGHPDLDKMDPSKFTVEKCRKEKENESSNSSASQSSTSGQSAQPTNAAPPGDFMAFASARQHMVMKDVMAEWQKAGVPKPPVVTVATIASPSVYSEITVSSDCMLLAITEFPLTMFTLDPARR